MEFHLQQMARRLCLEQIQNGKSWISEGNILGLASKIFQEDFKKYAPEIKDFLQDKENINPCYKSFVRERKSRNSQTRKRAWEQALLYESNNGLEWSDF